MRNASFHLATAFGASLFLAALAPVGGFAQSSPGKPANPGQPGGAETVPRPPEASTDAPPTDSRRAMLDELFARLAASQDEDETKGITRLIERRWLQSGSDTADLLMSRAIAAASADKDELAIELLDRVVVLQPNWAEAWNKRAVVFTSLGDDDRAILDLRRAVAQEPRHFTAWTGLGVLFRKTGDKKSALAAFKQALAIAPHLPDVEKVAAQLEIEVNGRDI
ncbi:MAG: tetratricopeptide repeat protein [Chelatococcus sp.]|uniref:tetratricopeptide repeat protein n=1 Tax=Chelatococcus sp. TaxID=1953771 RepID=UPI0025BFEC96|nr:tetratricopeptide repeat protein [Chelatococcus sp.]MBX3536270.1 tetratricopeptide repeat protein [Chelatococcus sp.]